MEEQLKQKDIVSLTGNAYQDDEAFMSEGGFVPERDQFYFEMKKDEDIFFVGLKDLLICLRLSEELGEIPKINRKWWQEISAKYGCADFDMIQSEEN